MSKNGGINMKNEDKKPRESSTPSSSPYEDLYGKPLTKEEAAVMHFNLVNFAETLIAMDRQKEEWEKYKKDQPKEEA
jgi:hypothetical protein